ncbi:GNAT family N-acetyltransferase [Streptomyces sp. NPDC085614]|uniref:GNAT family N-acetyltransferase n=1 Tax=Streptomyces sp. NPDC085614 TaxID=3365733 RepID=UPI0037D81091
MTWHFTEQAAVFRRAAAAPLAAAPARHTAVLTLVDGAELLGWWTGPDGRVTGTCAVSPPGVPVLGVMTGTAAYALARALPGAGAVTGVRGEADACEAFARALGRPWTTTRRMRLFRLGELTPPEPAPPGRARRATVAEIPFAVAWARQFARDVGEAADTDPTANITTRVTEGRLYFWEAHGVPRSMASVSPTLAGQARVSLVRTPPEERGRGFAGAVTSAVSRAALAAGAEQVLLFTDLANPTSNALYQRLGYRPLADHAALAIDAPA